MARKNPLAPRHRPFGGEMNCGMKIESRRNNRFCSRVTGLAIVWILCGSLSAIAQESERVWTSTSGSKIDAVLRDIDREKNEVSLFRKDGVEIRVPIASLSLDDQAYLQNGLARFAWTEVPALAPADPRLALALRAMQIEERLQVNTLKRGNYSNFTITRAEPLGYRERHLCHYSGEIPQQLAIDNNGSLVFLTLKTKPTAIQRISEGGSLSQIYATPRTEDSTMQTPDIGDESQIAAIPQGGFLLRARWKEVYQQNGNMAYTSRLNYFTMRIDGSKTAFTPHFSELSIISRSKIQTLESFGGDRLIVLDAGIGLYDLPKSSSKIDERSVSSPSDTSWTLGLFPLLVISESRLIAAMNRNGFRIVFLVDLKKRTYAPLGPVAATDGEMDAQLLNLAVSPDGQHLVGYNVSEKAFKRLKIDE